MGPWTVHRYTVHSWKVNFYGWKQKKKKINKVERRIAANVWTQQTWIKTAPKSIFWRTNPKKLAPTNSPNAKLFQFFFFLSCYSVFLDIKNTVATPNEFFYLKKSYNSIKNNHFSLLSQRLQTQHSFLLNISKLKQNQNTNSKTQS